MFTAAYAAAHAVLELKQCLLLMIIQRADVEHLHALHNVLEFLVNQVQLLLVDVLIEESGLA